VLKPTRVRINQTLSVLDLVFTNEEGMISNFEVLAPLGRSDHGMLSFLLNCYTDFEATDVKKRRYQKGNYELLRKNLNIDWKSVLAPFKGDAEKQLKILSDKIEEEVDLCIPSYTYRPGNNLQRIPVSVEFRKMNKRKRRLWTRYMETKDSSKYTEYCKYRNKVRALSQKNQKEYEKHIASRVREEPKLL